MLSRGYAGTMPDVHDLRADRAQWTTAAALPLLAATVAVAAWSVRG
jgi:cobalt/nickel transport system permease protein